MISLSKEEIEQIAQTVENALRDAELPSRGSPSYRRRRRIAATLITHRIVDLLHHPETFNN